MRTPRAKPSSFRPDELLEAALERSRHHHAVGVPDLAELIREPSVAIDDPVFDEPADGEAIECLWFHDMLSLALNV
jgi:hypothetical protein